MPQVKTIQFPNTAEGQASKNQALAQHLAAGWTVISETITPGQYNTDKACCLFMMCGPCGGFMGGYSDGVINVTLQHPADAPEVPPVSDQRSGAGASQKGSIIGLVLGLFLLVVLVRACTSNEKSQINNANQASPNAQEQNSMKKCELKGLSGATVYVFCPVSLKPADLASVAKQFGEQNFNQKMNQVHVQIFSNKKKTPKDTSALEKLSNEDVERYQAAVYSLNKNTNYLSFYCKRTSSSKISDCSELLK